MKPGFSEYFPAHQVREIQFCILNALDYLQRLIFPSSLICNSMRPKHLLSCSTTTFILLALLSCSSNNQSTARVEKIIKSMTLREKIEFIGGYKNFDIRGFEKYGIPEIRMSDGPVGVRNFGPTTAYPASITLAASWDKNLAKEVGASIGMEARSKNVHIMLGPGMNIHRAPFCGRNFEYLGEDPFLAGEIASTYINGMQEQGVVATAKHFAANDQEYDRNNVSSDMDERTLREIYLPAFEACVKKGQVGAVMTSYNLLNGIHCSQNDFLINQILKNDWDFKGVVMSDWTSTYDGVACALGGLDLEMPAGVHMHPDTLMAAIENGKLSEKLIDDKVRRILMLYERFGFFDNPDQSNEFILDSNLVRSTAIEAARGGITLLKNENRILPLNNSKPIKLAVIGINADPAVTGGGGSSYTTPLYPLSLLEAVKKVGGNSVEVIYAPAIRLEGVLPDNYFKKEQFYTYVGGSKQAGILGEFYGNVQLKDEPVFTKVFDRLDISLDDSVFAGVPDINYSARFTGYFKVERSGNYRMAVAGDDGYRVILNGKTIIEYWQNQPETVRSTDIALSKGVENKVIVEYYQGGGSASIRFAFDPAFNKQNTSETLWKNAVKAAEESDVVLISAGFNKNSETEGLDRTWDLPLGQDKMISQIASINKNCIVVLNSGGNVSMPWLNDIPALIHAWYPGQEGNLAVAEIIFGLTNPSGKLPVTFEKRWEDNATYTSYFDADSNLKVFYSEGIFLGYRHFDKDNIEPRFPFGFGLSYTSFEYSDLKISNAQFHPKEEIQVSFNIKNTGDVDGAEVAQLYVRDPESALPRPVKELKGFEKIFLKKGEQQSASIRLNPRSFQYFDPDLKLWRSEPGKFEILVGSSSKDIRLSGEIEMVE
jgi:beta-glucosidase